MQASASCTFLHLGSASAFLMPSKMCMEVPADGLAELNVPCRVLLQRDCCGGRRAGKGHPAAG